MFHLLTTAPTTTGTINLTPILDALIVLISGVITAFVVPWIKRNTSEKDRENMLRWIDIAVAAAQQLYYQEDGAKRKEYVMRFLKEKGYDVNTAEVDSAIEAAVLKLHKELDSTK